LPADRLLTTFRWRRATMQMVQDAEREQAEVKAFLADPAAYPDRPARVDRLETHGAIVFLAGNEAWKIKRAVRFPYMDFSTLEKRRSVCLRELEINRTWAPELYLGCVPITREPDGELKIDGKGEIVEWAIRMRRFHQDDLLDRIAENRGVDSALARSLADAAFDSHTKARLDPGPGGERLARLIVSVSRTLAELQPLLPQGHAQSFGEEARRWHERLTGLLDTRAEQGFVRRCHGDLHLGNIVLWQGRPLLFDAIEFDEEIATIDTLYDLAFLLMDLDHRSLKPAANVVLNRYLWRSNCLLNLDGLAAMPLFLALRAAVRAMVAAERAEQQRGEAAERKLAEARNYLAAALRYLHPPRPRLVAVAGLSGTGKSTLAATLAPELGPVPGAVHLRSDLERKALLGAGETQRLGSEGYTAEVTARVYATLLEKAEHTVASGHAAIVDAVYARADEREHLEQLGRRLGVPLRGLWLTAPAETLLQRVATRRNDASDATVDVVKAQLGHDIGRLSPAWTTIDAGRDRSATTSLARTLLGV
jgi:aminoglycoside phosphotransferase family enzyme/predicted kinase